MNNGVVVFDFSKLVSWISNTGNVAKKESGKVLENRRRFKRLISDKCKVNIGTNGPFEVINLSFGGMRVDLGDSQLRYNLKVNQQLPCHLFLDTVNIEINIRVRNIETQYLGCSFSELSPAHSRAISEFIKPVLLGRSMREIDAKILKSGDSELKMRWFQGDDNIQIFMWQTQDGENVKQEYYFLDYMMTWDKEGSIVKTGKIISNGRRGYGRLDPSSVAFFDFPPYKAIKLGKTILEAANLPNEIKDQMLEGIISEEKRFFYRYLLGKRGENVTFLPEGHNKPIVVANISMNGMALLKQSGNNYVDEPKSCSGTLHIQGKNIRCEFDVIYSNSHLIGGNLNLVSKDEKLLLDKFLAPRLIAQFLEKMPSPVELPKYAPPGAVSSLYSGLHNTHILSLLSKSGKLVAGRITFMDKIIAFERRKIVEYKCLQGIVFPSDWEIISYKVSPCNKPSAEALNLCKEILENSEIVDGNIKLAWLEQLSI